ncbi:oligosaccharyl transferase complex subunit ost4 [Fusarium heterosporum]|uniref:Dolichyl-diphosphooligosaccharide--protein glycosyltransferase subunit OST2 n=1 Tax=Fusarium heterosporum TaxID=42747 RepID=A0A8H5TA86_FUSHE|nr:oligosaccharyl transferase complex subunit ost4 [Fusarium heterosporum]
MAKKNVRDVPPVPGVSQEAVTGGPVPQPQQPKPAVILKKGDPRGDVQWDKAIQTLYSHYINNTPQRIKLVDAFMAFLVVVGVIQFINCALLGTFPFNAFLSGFCVTVGQFVLTASLRLQTNEASKTECPSVSPERAFADYVVCSLILHFFAINFIN